MSIAGDALIWIDLEMDGLDLKKNFILEIACIVTDFYLTEVHEGPDLVVHHPQSLLDAMGPWCTEHHTSSGLVQQVLDSALSMADAETAVMNFIEKVTAVSSNKQRLILAGNSVYVDRYFLEKDMPRLNAMLDASIVDCSAMRELIRRFNFSVFYNTPMKSGQLHRALDDIRNSIAEFRYYRDEAFAEQTSPKDDEWPKDRDVNQFLLWIEFVQAKVHCVLTDRHLNVVDEMTEAETSADLLQFCSRNRIRSKCTVPLAGRALGPLRAQLKNVAEEFNEFCHYRSIDVDVISVICENLFPRIYQRRPKASRNKSLFYSIELLRYYRSTIFK